MKNRPLTVRWLKPGDMFELKRTGEKYQYISTEINKPGGTKYWVRRLLEKERRTLHHSCHIRII